MTTTNAATLDARTDYENIEMTDLTASERRSVRARTEQMVVVPQTDADGLCIGIYNVYSQSGEHYVVDIDHQQRCDCPDTQYNHADPCKHRRRVAMMVSETDCPAPGQPIGDYETTLDEVRQALERERSALLGDVESVDTLLDGLDQ